MQHLNVSHLDPVLDGVGHQAHSQEGIDDGHDDRCRAQDAPQGHCVYKIVEMKEKEDKTNGC